MLLVILSRHKNTNTAAWGYICTSCYVSCIFSFVCTIKPQLVSFSSTPLSSMTQLLRKGVIHVTSLMSGASILSNKHPQSCTICRSFPVCMCVVYFLYICPFGTSFSNIQLQFDIMYLDLFNVFGSVLTCIHFYVIPIKFILFPLIIALALCNLYCYA